MADQPTTTLELDVAIVGAGFAGMYMLHRMHQDQRAARVFEAASGVGGTWYWNRYPGARCDVESLEYCYSFDKDLEQEWSWPERYSTQPDIEKYANHVADRFDLRKDIQFNTRVTAATFDDASERWIVETDQGDRVSAQYLVMGTGCLSAPIYPDFAGMESFSGESYHTGLWPKEEIDFGGKRVAIIGTGSSGIQATPVIAETAKSVTVFQRTPSFSLPSDNGPLDPVEVADVKAHYDEVRAANQLLPAALGARWGNAREDSVLEASVAEREEVLEDAWTQGGFTFMRAYPDLALTPEANTIAADFVRGKIRSTVEDPATAALLSPEVPIGCKRMVMDSGYYEAFNQPNVSLVDIRAAPIEEITPDGIRTADAQHDFDIIVYATGFDAMTGALLRIDIRGRGGETLREAWSAGPRTYLGLNVAGFPNLFTITGPGSPSVLANMIIGIEQHVNFITDCMTHMSELGRQTIEATPEAQESWVDHVNSVVEGTVFVDPRCNSWYLGANVEGKTRVFMPLPGYPQYVEKCEEVVAKGYEGFVLA
ncbi:MAG TPA: NAD(P)/FAD-dependent oxidoreductase [Dehalococcoidia bacterium]|nr:NAD(P)/FAD-dependent oxidoreductase [Dehalococcoidia bacterium]